MTDRIDSELLRAAQEHALTCGDRCTHRVAWTAPLATLAWVFACLPGGNGSVAQAGRLLSVGDAARRLGLSERTVRRRAKQWSFTRRLGARVLRFDAAGLETWLAKQANTNQGRAK